ncbi:MAG TPA: hypothetical protein VGH87_24450 [Polyangiaceae bacterium]
MSGGSVDPFRSELEAAHARIEKLESDHKAQVEKLERENDRLRKRLVDAAPPSQSKTGKTFFGVAMMTLGLSIVAGMIFARAVNHPGRPAPIFEVPVEIPNAVEIGDDTPDPSDFDRDAVASALKGVRLAACTTSHGSGHVKLVIATSGVVTEAHVDRGPFTNTSEGRCIESQFRAVRVPGFTLTPRTVGKAFTI